MAELGTVAAAIELAQVAIKLRKLWSEVTEAPKAIRDLANETVVLAEMLGQVQHTNVTCDRLTAPCGSWSRCHQHFVDAAESLRQLVGDLDLMLKSHKRTGAIRAFLKREELNRCRDRLERTKTTLLLAQQSFQFTMLSQQNTTILEEIRALAVQQPFIGRGLISASTEPKSGCEEQKQSKHIIVQRSRNQFGNRKRPNAKYELRFPPWLLRKGVQLLVEKSTGSWGVVLRVYNTVESHSEVFQAAREGDWIQVQQLFDRGKASPFDVNQWGATLLHVAAENVDVPGCRLLLGLGHDPCNDSNWHHKTPLEEMTGFESCRDKSKSEDLLEVTRMLADSFDDLIREFSWNIFGCLPPAAISVLTDTIFPAWEFIDPVTRVVAALSTASPIPDSLFIILGSNLSLFDAFSLADANDLRVSHITLLRTIGSHLARIVKDQEHVALFTKEWHPVLDAIIEYERRSVNSRRILFQARLFDTLLFGFVTDYYDHEKLRFDTGGKDLSMNQQLSSVVRMWVNWLDSVGVNIVHYGAAEKAGCFFCTNHSDQFLIHLWKQDYAARVVGLLYGPTAEDWSIFVVPAEYHIMQWSSPSDGQWVCDGNGEYEMAAEFWEWVENPELFFTPGGWVGDEVECEWTPMETEDFYPINNPRL